MTVVYEEKLPLNLDCCEFNKKESLLLCACYELNEATQERDGMIILYKAEEPIDKLSSTRVAGVFDTKWLRVGGDIDPRFSVAQSDGNIRIFSVNQAENTISESFSHSVTDDFCLAVDQLRSKNETVVAASSDGCISVLDLGTSALTLESSVLAHKYPYLEKGAEIWTIAADPFQEKMFITGSEDQSIKMWDSRAISSPVTVNRTTHQAGVCCVSFDPMNENSFVSGCYDGMLRLFDKRRIKSPILQMDCSGGPWDIKFHPTVSSYISIACMRSGFLVLDLHSLQNYDSDKLSLAELQENSSDSIKFHFNDSKNLGEFESLAYGIDFLTKNRIATGSFYDKNLRVFQIESK